MISVVRKLTIEEIKKIDVRHTSFLPDGVDLYPDGCKMYDNFLIVDTLLERIEELESALSKEVEK